MVSALLTEHGMAVHGNYCAQVLKKRALLTMKGFRHVVFSKYEDLGHRHTYKTLLHRGEKVASHHVTTG